MQFKFSMASFSRRGLAHTLAAALVAPLLFGALSTSVHAQTVDDIKKKGKLVIGIQGDNAPFGFVDSQGVQQGYDSDIGKLLAKEMGVQVEFVPVAIANRIPALTSGKVDILIATMGMYPDRAKAVQFSKPYASNDVGIVAPKALPIASIADVGKYIIGSPRASAQDTQLTKNAPAGTEIRRFDDDAATIQALLSGQVQAVAGNNFYPGRLNAVGNGTTYEMKVTFFRQWNGISTRLGQKELNTYINTFVDKIRANGDIAKNYQKWMGFAAPAEWPASVEGVPFTAQ